MAQSTNLKKKTKEGTYEIYTAVLSRIVEETVKKNPYGLSLLNNRGPFLNWVTRAAGARVMDAIEIAENKKGVHITVFVVSRIGTSFEESATALVDAIRTESIQLIGIELASVKVILSGTVTHTGILTSCHMEYKG